MCVCVCVCVVPAGLLSLTLKLRGAEIQQLAMAASERGAKQQIADHPVGVKSETTCPRR